MYKPDSFLYAYIFGNLYTTVAYNIPASEGLIKYFYAEYSNRIFQDININLVERCIMWPKCFNFNLDSYIYHIHQSIDYRTKFESDNEFGKVLYV